jgi:D-2-hydroxyacid dehydrogenase (NADP+)
MTLERIGIHESVEAVFPPRKLEAELESIDHEVVVVGDDLDSISTCEAIVTFAYRAAFLDAELDWIHSIQAGYDRFPLDELEREGIVLTNSSGIHGTSVGEMGVGLMLALARRIGTYVKNQTERRWDRLTWNAAFTVEGEQLCVVGLGTLGRGIAERADALGMEVVGVKRTPEDVPGVEQIYTPANLHDAIADARFVALTVPLTDETEGLIGPGEFEIMREDAYLVNVARGPVVDQDALVAALDDGALAGAALDVFEEEPLPEESPLWDHENVLVTPHVAAAEVDYYRHIADLVAENVRRRGTGEAWHNRVV